MVGHGLESVHGRLPGPQHGPLSADLSLNSYLQALRLPVRAGVVKKGKGRVPRVAGRAPKPRAACPEARGRHHPAVQAPVQAHLIGIDAASRAVIEEVNRDLDTAEGILGVYLEYGPSCSMEQRNSLVHDLSYHLLMSKTNLELLEFHSVPSSSLHNRHYLIVREMRHATAMANEGLQPA
eukprot:764867-Hanusia_phi.AAC.14